MKKFVIFIMLAIFFVTCEYGITRPASQALLITYYSSKIIPYIWLATIPLNFLTITLYNRYLSRIGPLKMLSAIAVFTILLNGLTGFIAPVFNGCVLFQFAWKDLYILLMLKQVWSLIHSTIPAANAKYLYGIIYAFGTVGAISGSLVPSLFAIKFGSEHLFYLTLPVYLLLMFFFAKAYKHSTFIPTELVEPKEKGGAFALVFKSPYLVSVLLLTVLMQMTVALMEYQFNANLEINILEKDLRTQWVGQMMTYVNLVSGFLQIVGSYLVIHLLGVRGSHLAIPMLLLLNIATLIAVPSFVLISFSFVFIKAVDFSLFGIIKEMLFVPMKLDEKYRAKAVIDVFAYRSSKAIVSLCIVGVQIFAGVHVLPWASTASIALILMWLCVSWFMLRRYYPQQNITIPQQP